MISIHYPRTSVYTSIYIPNDTELFFLSNSIKSSELTEITENYYPYLYLINLEQ